MKPKTVLIIITILILILTLILTKIPSKTVTNIPTYIHTKAICDESNYCEDYIIECSEDQPTKITPTGLSIQHQDNWKDPRENGNELCN